MAKKKNNDPLASLKLSAEERYDEFVELVVSNEALWTLKDYQGLVLLTSDGDDCIPFWPNEQTAKAMAVAEWSEAVPEQIALTDWVERWAAGMDQDGVLVSIFPNHQDNGTIDNPLDLLSVIAEMDSE